ncbi:uncharacterized protein A1O9_08973 [Exophiala aquamarina CBS 119918]|uniref:Bromodomain-containing factor 1 n=1 Tax=Exophiala aquamarina CBS 119918 TaxID=1182545 RepID=A0A072P5G8_9EURO|nr:uncharacterized protein A1O9_08973 [Exophiala aquamarina CBS 119918]KEF55319.1 hypothetical protein A1O9_08973 [Exophiala aquamarina CBS 119918]
MDVDMQLEANSSTSDQPQEPHVAENLAASISNSEATVNPLPTKLPITESSPQNEKPSAATDATPVAVPALPPEDAPPAIINGMTNDTAEAVENLKSISSVPDSQPTSSANNSLPAPSTTTSIVDTVLADSFSIPSPAPAETQPSLAAVETSDSAMDLSQPTAAVSDPPVSDLRTQPHSDALSPEAVAEIETQKHQLDNSVDASGAPAKSEISEKAPSTEGTQSGPEPSVDQVTLTDIGLPSPTQSPPPAPQPTHAELPADKPAENAVMEPVLLPAFGSVQIAEAAPPTESAPALVPAPASEPGPTLGSLQTEGPAAPSPSPAPAPTPAPSRQIELEDQIMTDVVAAPAKQAREREDDSEEQGRAAKRVKTDEPDSKTEDSSFKVPHVPAVTAQSPLANGNTAANKDIVDADDSVTPARLAHMRKVISNLKKSNASSAFRQPVDYIALKIPNYPEVVKHPMDLSTIDNRLKHNKYTSVTAFIRDFEQIVTNCFLFNGLDHGVSQQAKKMQSSFNSQMNNLPKATVEEPSKESKKAAKKAEPTRSAPPRRPSVSTSGPGMTTAASPKTAAPPTPSFAPGPDGIPLIRRDSSLTDGRPKRAIVPTKRNQDLGSGRPKKKKYELQLRFCDEVLKEISNPKHWQMNQYFLYPVDPVALNIPTYFQIVKKPMDLGTIKTQLANNGYEKAKDFEEDVRLIFKNCFKFNPDGDLVNAAGHQLEELFNKKWATKDDWIASREPQSEPHTDADEDEEDEEDSDDEPENESEDERNDKIKQLQKQIEMMSKQMGELTQKKSKKSKSPPVKKSKSKGGKKDKQAAVAPGAGKDKKEKKKTAPKSKPEKDRYVTFAEKQYISNGIAMLPEKQMQEALKIIQNSVPSLANSDQNEIELDIEDVPNHALLRLLNFVKKYAGPPPDEPKAERPEVYSAPAAAKHKKSKPMSKHEQEAQIEELKGKLGAYAGGTMSPSAVQSIEEGDSSDDDGDSEESEEE